MHNTLKWHKTNACKVVPVLEHAMISYDNVQQSRTEAAGINPDSRCSWMVNLTLCLIHKQQLPILINCSKHSNIHQKFWKHWYDWRNNTRLTLCMYIWQLYVALNSIKEKGKPSFLCHFKLTSRRLSYFKTDGQSVCLGVEPILELVFLSERCCLRVAALFLWGALSDERTGLQSAVQTLNGLSSTEPVTILYCLIWDSPNLEGQVPVFISPRNHFYLNSVTTQGVRKTLLLMLLQTYK
jgi:hypothetical protein